MLPHRGSTSHKTRHLVLFPFPPLAGRGQSPRLHTFEPYSDGVGENEKAYGCESVPAKR